MDVDSSHYVSRVLRLEEGAALWLFDAQGRGCHAIVRGATGGQVSVQRQGAITLGNTQSMRIRILCGVSKGRKLDEVVRKASELGAAELIPVLTARSIPSGKGGEGKLDRWRRIAGEAARQSRRDFPLQVSPLRSLKEGLEPLAEGSVGIVLWESEEDLSLARLCQGESAPQECFLLFGPEGGLTEDEVELARECGYRIASLGPRILRAETAPLASIAVVQSLWGDCQ